MTRRNPFDEMRETLAAAYRADKESLAKDMEGVPPYNSVKLDEEEERLLFQFPERIFPDGVGDRGEARKQLKQMMGPDLYAKWIKKQMGV